MTESNLSKDGNQEETKKYWPVKLLKIEFYTFVIPGIMQRFRKHLQVVASSLALCKLFYFSEITDTLIKIFGKMVIFAEFSKIG